MTMFRKLLFPIAAGWLVGKGIKMAQTRRYKRLHPLRSLFLAKGA
jgi:hypothetical protein